MAGFMDLLALKSQLEGLTIDSDVNAFLPALRKVGFEDYDTVKAALEAIRAVATDPTATLGAFIQEGGLARLLSGKRGGGETTFLACPHCQELIAMQE